MRKWLLWLMGMALLLAGCSGQSDGTPDSSAQTPPAQSQPSGEAGDAPGTEENPPQGSTVPSPEGNVVEISERLFIAQTNDIYINTADYLGKTIKYEGLFKTMYWPDEDETYRYVIRYGPGCCGYDGEAGFEVYWDGDWPEEDAWCEVVGVLELYEINGLKYPRLVLSSLTVLEERGAEFVST